MTQPAAHAAEIVTGPDGRQVLRLPREIVEAGAGVARIAALEAEISAIRAREAQPDRIARTGAAFEAWARDQVEAQQARLKESVDGAAVVGARIASALEALVAAIGAKELAVTVNQAGITFSPTIHPAVVENKIAVEARVQLPPPREKKIAITVDEHGNAEGTVS